MSNFNLGKETSIFKAKSDSFPGPWAESQYFRRDPFISR